MSGSIVQRYYDNNTSRFLRFGQHEGTRNIHQPLWPAHVNSVSEAVNVSNELVYKELLAVQEEFGGAELQVLDLGCGVGASVVYLAERAQERARFLGITISEVQSEFAKNYAIKHSLSRCEFMQGDFLDLPSMAPVHLAYSIEAFLHATDASAYLAQVAGCLAPQGRLVIVDDFLTARGAHSALSSKEKGWMNDYRDHWLANSLVSEERVGELAASHGLRLVKSDDLTPLMRLGRPRDKLIGVARTIAGPLMRRSLYLGSLAGGYGKQQCIKAGLVQYRHLVFERAA